MRIVLTHTGSPVPEYARYCVEEINLHNPDVIIDFIVDYNHILDASRLLYGTKVQFVASDSLRHDETLQKFRQHSWFKAWGTPNTTYPSPENFVQGTSERLFLLNAYLKATDSKNVWHFENDNLIYENLTQVTAAVLNDKRYDDKLVCCDMGPDYLVMNVVFIAKPDYLSHAMDWYAELLTNGDQKIRETYHIEMVHEMTALKQYSKFHNIGFLPSIPGFPNHEPLLVENPKDFTHYGLYFDPAGYGQYIAGTNCGHGPGFTDTVNHDIGKAINAGKIHAFMGHYGTYDAPAIAFPNSSRREVPLFNLHMHNKTRIKDYASRKRF